MRLLIQWAITSGALILIFLTVRRLFRDKLSARLRYLLWLVVLVRLLVPFQAELPAKVSESVPLTASNLAPAVDRWEERSVPVFPQSSRPAAEYNGITFDLMEPGEIMPTETSMGYYRLSQDGETVTRYMDLWSPAQIAVAVWGTGAVFMTLVLLVSNLRFALRLWKRRKPLEVPDVPLRVYAAEGLPSPCLFGVFRPAVYVTPEAAENPDALRHVLAHELTHYAHRDHIWSLLRCLALALHWHNPLVWLAVGLSKGDGELACDEGAVARLGDAERISYGRTLVDMVAARSARPADLLSCSTAMTGGGKSIQQRVARLVKKPKTVKIALFAAAAVVALSVVFVFAQRGDSSANSLGDFPAQLEEAQCILVGQPLYYSSIVPGTISDPVLLEQAKKLLTNPQPVYWLEPDGDWSGGWDPVSLDSNHPPELITFEDLNDQFFHTGHPLSLYPDAGASQPENANRYWLVEWESLWLLAQWDAQNDARPFTLLGYYSGNVVSQLRELARQQTELNRDPSLPRPMSQDELSQYDIKFIRGTGVTQLRGRPDSMESAVFHAGSTSPDEIQLWYRGDETHDDVWVLALEKESYALLADQPIEVFNAVRNAREEVSYEQLGPGAFAASLRPGDVVSVTAGDYSPGQAVPVDIPTLKEQLIDALYHQFSGEYDREKYGRYVLTIQVEKDVDYYLHDGGADGLTLSVGAEPDVVCMRHRILASPNEPMSRYVYSPELYRTIRDLFD